MNTGKRDYAGRGCTSLLSGRMPSRSKVGQSCKEPGVTR